jgi:8-oxo-dGTP pyrophosphatase MutT (NUDIX family)
MTRDYGAPARLLLIFINNGGTPGSFAPAGIFPPPRERLSGGPHADRGVDRTAAAGLGPLALGLPRFYRRTGIHSGRKTLSRMDELARQLTAAERRQPFPNRRPRDAATLILLDRSGAAPKVLLGKRHHGHVFVPGQFVFPGGRVEPHDRVMPASAPLDPRVEAQLLRLVARPSPARGRALALAAIRETFEETGLLLGAARRDAPPAPAGPWREFAQRGLYPDLSALHFIARAITPPRHPRRFDTRFFAVDASAVAHRVDNVMHADAELVELTWLPIDEARAMDIQAVTDVALQELEARLAAGFGHDLPVPFYRMRQRRFTRELLGG